MGTENDVDSKKKKMNRKQGMSEGERMGRKCVTLSGSTLSSVRSGKAR